MLRNIIPHLCQTPLVFTFFFQLPWEAMTKSQPLRERLSPSQSWWLMMGYWNRWPMKINFWLIKSLEVTWVLVCFGYCSSQLNDVETVLQTQSALFPHWASVVSSGNIGRCAKRWLQDIVKFHEIEKPCWQSECHWTFASFRCLHWATTLASWNGFLTKTFKERNDNRIKIKIASSGGSNPCTQVTFFFANQKLSSPIPAKKSESIIRVAGFTFSNP